MGFFKDEKMEKVIGTLSSGLEEAMSKLNKNGGFIDEWSFDEDGNILLFQKFNCGCSKILNKINIEIEKEKIEVIKEREFINQVEDMLLEISLQSNYDNLLFNINDYKKLIKECSECKE